MFASGRLKHYIAALVNLIGVEVPVGVNCFSDIGVFDKVGALLPYEDLACNDLVVAPELLKVALNGDFIGCHTQKK